MFSAGQLERLEERFHQNQYLIGKERVELAKELDLSEMQVLFVRTYPLQWTPAPMARSITKTPLTTFLFVPMELFLLLYIRWL